MVKKISGDIVTKSRVATINLKSGGVNNRQLRYPPQGDSQVVLITVTTKCPKGDSQVVLITVTTKYPKGDSQVVKKP